MYAVSELLKSVKSKLLAQNKTAASAVDQTPGSSNIQGIQCGRDLTVQGDVKVRIKNVSSKTEAAPPEKCESFCICDAPITNFVGREDELKEIHSLLTSCAGKKTWLERTVIIYGIGGMGKSELARKYVAEHINDPIIQNVAWIDSETKAGVENSFKSIAEEFEIKTENVRLQKIVKDVYTHFSKNFQSGLFIFDNVEQLRNEEPYFGILDYLPKQQLQRLPLILITSRIKDFEAPKGRDNTLGISELKEDQSVDLLEAQLKLTQAQRNDTKIQEAVRSLAKVLQGYPLGLTLAAANICCDGGANVAAEIRKYIALLDAPNAGWMRHKHSLGSASDYNRVMDGVWGATIGKIKGMGVDGECALTLLNVVAFLPTDDIRKWDVDDIINFGYSSLKDHLLRGYSILEKYSLIRLNKRNIQIHRHVQRCTRESLDSIPDHSYLLTVGQFISYRPFSDNNTQIHIHRHFKQRKWPHDSLVFSIDFLRNESIFSFRNITELAMDLNEALETEHRAFSHLLNGGCRTLMEFRLYIVSELHDWRKEIPDARRLQWNTKYENRFDEELKIFIKYARSRSPPSGVCEAVTARIESYFKEISKGKYKFRSDKVWIKMRDAFIEEIHDPSTDSDLRYFFLKRTYGCLDQIYGYQEGKNIPLNLKTALELHLKYYTSNSSWQNGDYWKDKCPINYMTLRDRLKRLKWKRTTQCVATDLEKSILDVIVFHGGLQVVQQHLDVIISDWGIYSYALFDFLMLLVTEFNCSEDFKKAPKFLCLLKHITAMAFELPKLIDYCSRDVQWLLLWFGLFPDNCAFEETERRKWSLESVTEEMKAFSYILEDQDFWDTFKDVKCEKLMIRALRPHLELSEWNPRDGWVFKTAVEFMDRDIRGRLNLKRLSSGRESWKTEFKEKFTTRESTPLEIWEVGKKHGLVSD